MKGMSKEQRNQTSVKPEAKPREMKAGELRKQRY